MEYEIIGVDLANGPDKTGHTKRSIQEEIYQSFGLTREQVETEENNGMLLQFKELNNMN
jgi:hypothetical protein